jgi:hypothetical protein
MCDLQLWISQTCAIQVQSRPADGASLLTHVDLAFLKLQGEQSSMWLSGHRSVWNCWVRFCFKQEQGPYTALHLMPFTSRGARDTQLWCLSLLLQALLLTIYTLSCACPCIAILWNLYATGFEVHSVLMSAKQHIPLVCKLFSKLY